MSKASRTSKRTTKRPTRGRARTIEAIPLASLTPTEERLALKFDGLVTSATAKGRQIKALQSEIIGAKVRGGSATLGKAFLDFGKTGFVWPDILYVPRDQKRSSRPIPPDSRLYSHDWTGGTGVATASRDSGGLFAFASAATNVRSESSDAAVGITYVPIAKLSYVKYEPEVYCSFAYRMFVDFWPRLIAGQVQLGASVITGQWRRSPVLSGSYELLRWNETAIFDSFAQDAGSTIFPNQRHTLQRNFLSSSLSTTFLVEGGREYIFGAVVRAWVKHNVTSNTGEQIQQDADKFRLYSELVCSVPYMGVAVQQVLVP